jgi:hypothetical protein
MRTVSVSTALLDYLGRVPNTVKNCTCSALSSTAALVVVFLIARWRSEKRRIAKSETKGRPKLLAWRLILICMCDTQNS